MKYGILMRNVIFLVDKRTTKMIKPGNITKAHPPPYPVFHFDVFVKTLVSFGKKAVYEEGA